MNSSTALAIARQRQLQVAKADTQVKTLGRHHNFGRRHEGSATPIESTTCTSRLVTHREKLPMTNGNTVNAIGELGLCKATPPRR